LDGIRPFYNELSSLQTTAFHEFIADLTSILSALNNKKIRKYVANETDADLRKKNTIERIAEQFGDEIYKYGEAARPYLRSALEPLISIQNIKDDWGPHKSSLVMTKAMWKILSEFVLINHPPESKKNSKKWKTQAVVDGYTTFKRLALRALDYCPPVDIQFIDYVHAMLKADREAYPVDKNNYRGIIRDVFHKAGFCIKSNYSHEGCILEPPETPKNYEFGDYDIERISESRTSAYHFLNLNREELHIPYTQDIAVVDLYATHKEVENKRKLRKEIIIEYIWREDVPLKGSRFGKLEGKNIQLLCGGTLVFDGRGNILYFVNKSGTKIKNNEQKEAGKKRRSKLLKYIASLVKKGQIGLVDQGKVLDAWIPTVRGHQVDGALRFEMTPHLRHSGDG
jgi:hypothetical protein